MNINVLKCKQKTVLFLLKARQKKLEELGMSLIMPGIQKRYSPKQN